MRCQAVREGGGSLGEFRDGVCEVLKLGGAAEVVCLELVAEFVGALGVVLEVGLGGHVDFDGPSRSGRGAGGLRADV